MKFYHKFDKIYEQSDLSSKSIDRNDKCTFICTCIGYVTSIVTHISTVAINEVEAMEEARDDFKQSIGEYPYMIIVYDNSTKV